MTETTGKRLPWWRIGLLICLAGAAVGHVFSAMFDPITQALGASGGLLAGAIWTYWMARQSRGNNRNLTGAGTLLGLVVGLIATAVMHSHMIWELAHEGPRRPGGELPSGDIYWSAIFPIGIGCGLAAGALVGLVCGAICDSMARRLAGDGDGEVTEPPCRPVPWWKIAPWVCPVAVAVGASFGSPKDGVTMITGSVGGLLAGCLWSRWMARQTLAGKPGLVWPGFLLGMLAGLVATIAFLSPFLLWTLQSARIGGTESDDPASSLWFWAMGFPFAAGVGVAVGGMVGLVCGAICHAMARRGRAS